MAATWYQLGIAIITSMGIGSIISTCISINYQQKKLIFESKLTKYSNLIQSWNERASEGNDQNLNSSLNQVNLIGSDKVIAAIKNFENSRGAEMFNNIITAMHEDLEQSK